LERHWQARRILVADSELLWSVTLPALGMDLDVEATVDSAFLQARSLDRLGARLSGRHWIDVDPIVRFDPVIAAHTVQALRPQIDIRPTNTSLQLVNGRVEAVEPVPGRSLDVVKTVNQLAVDPLAVIETGRLGLSVQPVPPLAIDVSAALSKANEWLAHTLNVVAYDPIADEAVDWSVAPERWGEWVSFSASTADPTDVSWRFDRPAATVAVDAWEASLGDGRYVHTENALDAIEDAMFEEGWSVRLRVYHYPSRHIVQSGETLSSISRQVGIPYPWIEQANPGVSDSLHVGQVLIIPSPDVLLPLPVVEHKRIVISLLWQRLWAYENGALIWEWPVSTGIASSPTAPGVFQVQSHDPKAYASSWDLWMPYFMGIYRPVPTSGFMNGFHGFPTRDGSTLLWTGNLGHPVTFGCILLGHTSAPLLYEWAEEGVIVEIRE
jgi:LysM repeat protein